MKEREWYADAVREGGALPLAGRKRVCMMPSAKYGPCFLQAQGKSFLYSQFFAFIFIIPPHFSDMLGKVFQTMKSEDHFQLTRRDERFQGRAGKRPMRNQMRRRAAGDSGLRLQPLT